MQDNEHTRELEQSAVGMCYTAGKLCTWQILDIPGTQMGSIWLLGNSQSFYEQLKMPLVLPLVSLQFTVSTFTRLDSHNLERVHF